MHTKCGQHDIRATGKHLQQMQNRSSSYNAKHHKSITYRSQSGFLRGASVNYRLNDVTVAALCFKVSDLMNQGQNNFMDPVHLFTYFWTTSQAKLEFV